MLLRNVKTYSVLPTNSRFRAAKQNRNDKKLDILTACSNAAVKGQRFLKMHVRWIVFPIIFTKNLLTNVVKNSNGITVYKKQLMEV